MTRRDTRRAADELRPVRITRNYLKHAMGSCIFELGDTRVLCAASVEEGVSAWRRGSGQGWVTAEYSMLPASTHKSTIFSHSAHVLTSSVASIMYLVSFGLADWVSAVGMVFVYMVFAVMVPCCTSDIVFPLLLASGPGAGAAGPASEPAA